MSWSNVPGFHVADIPDVMDQMILKVMEQMFLDGMEQMLLNIMGANVPG